MPTCQNCGAHVTPAYVRVFEPDEDAGTRACPFCDDLIRSGNTIRPSRSPRH